MSICTKIFRFLFILLLAFIINVVFFFAVPVLNTLFFDRGEKKKTEITELTEVEYNVQEKKQETQKKSLRMIVQPNSFKATRSTGASRAKGFKMDLSLAHGEGGEGVGVALGAAENVVYEAGEVDEQAKVLREMNPVYPERAKKAGIAGTVKVLLVIDVHGNVSSVDVLSVNPPGYGFEVEAVKAVREWKFEPAKLGSYPVAQKATKEFNFVR